MSAILPVAGPVGAASVEACTPAPKEPTSFCVTSELKISSKSSSPVNLSFQLANTSDSNSSATRLSTAVVTIAPTTSGPFGVTPSVQMPQGLVIAATPSCTAPAYTDCAAYGTARVTTTGFGAGNYNGTFGVERVFNVNPPASGYATQYAGTLNICVEAFGDPCFLDLQEEFSLAIPAVSGPEPIAFTLPLRYTGDISGGGSYDASVHTLNLGVSGTSNQIYNGSTVEPTTTTRVLSTPQLCGSATSTVTASTTQATPRVVTTERAHSFSLCPIARLSIAYDGFTATFDASASEAQGSRSLRHYVWNFGDGTTRTTTAPIVKRTYGTFGNHDATLYVRDSAGARSRVLTRRVRGTTTTAAVTKTAQHVNVAGSVSPDHTGEVKVELERKVGGAFERIAIKRPALTAGDYVTQFARPAAGDCRIRTTFAGDADHLGSWVVKLFRC